MWGRRSGKEELEEEEWAWCGKKRGKRGQGNRNLAREQGEDRGKAQGTYVGTNVGTNVGWNESEKQTDRRRSRADILKKKARFVILPRFRYLLEAMRPESGRARPLFSSPEVARFPIYLSA